MHEKYDTKKSPKKEEKRRKIKKMSNCFVSYDHLIAGMNNLVVQA